MKLASAALTFVFAFSLSDIAQSTSSPATISKQELMAEYARSPAQSAKPISKQQLALMIANAKTSADHLKIADYYRTQSKSLMAESIKHAWMGADYARSPVMQVHYLYDHCAWLTKHLKAESLKDAELAKQHEQMARAAELN